MTTHLLTDYRDAMRRRGLSPGTVAARGYELRRWLDWIGDRWATADRHDVERWLDGRPLAARARYTSISHLHAFYVWARREGFVDDDPTELVDRPRLPQRLPRPCTRDQVDRLLADAGDLSVVVLLMVDAGLRCCEVARLRWCDVDLQAGTLYVSGKGARERLVGIPQRLRLALYVAEADGVGEWVAGRALTAGRVSQLISRLAAQCGLTGVTAHRLRHTYATRLYRATHGDLGAVQRALGHSSVATTQIYAQVDAERVVAAARLLD